MNLEYLIITSASRLFCLQFFLFSFKSIKTYLVPSNAARDNRYSFAQTT